MQEIICDRQISQYLIRYSVRHTVGAYTHLFTTPSDSSRALTVVPMHPTTTTSKTATATLSLMSNCGEQHKSSLQA